MLPVTDSEGAQGLRSSARVWTLVLQRGCRSSKYQSLGLEYCQRYCISWSLSQDLAFEDGDPPPDTVIDEWFKLTDLIFTTKKGTCVAVHCVAGLGRYWLIRNMKKNHADLRGHLNWWRSLLMVGVFQGTRHGGAIVDRGGHAPRGRCSLYSWETSRSHQFQVFFQTY